MSHTLTMKDIGLLGILLNFEWYHIDIIFNGQFTSASITKSLLLEYIILNYLLGSDNQGISIIIINCILFQSKWLLYRGVNSYLFLRCGKQRLAYINKILIRGMRIRCGF